MWKILTSFCQSCWESFILPRWTGFVGLSTTTGIASTPDYAQEVKAEQIRLLYEQLPSMLIAHTVSILAATIILWGHVSPSLLLGWGGACALVILGRYGLLRAYEQANAGLPDAPHWGRVFLVGSGLAGICLGAVGFVLFPAQSPAHQAFVGFLLAGMSAVGAATLSSVRECYLVFLVPTVLPFALRLLVHGSDIAVAMGVMSMLFMAVMWQVSERLYASLTKLLRVSYENVVLLNDLDYANQGLKLANEALTGQVLEKRHVEEALRASEKSYRTLVETTNTGYLMLDLAGSVIDANEEYLRLTGYASLDEIIGHSVVEWTAPDDIERNAEEIEKCIRLGYLRNLEIDYMDLSGNITPVEINANLVKTELGLHMLCLCRDITARRRAEHRQQLLNALLSLPIEGHSLHQMSERALDLILESMQSDVLDSGAIFLADLDGPEPLLAAERDVPPTLMAACLGAVSQSLALGGTYDNAPWFTELAYPDRSSAKQGSSSRYFLFQLTAREQILGVLMMRLPRHPLNDLQDLDFIRSICQTFGGIIDRKRAEVRIERLAYYDTLTGLPNRRLLEDRLKQAIAQADRHREQLAVIFLDLDRFKAVNDALGHSYGDMLLNEAGQRLAACVRGSDTVARLGGDEFLVVLSGVQGEALQTVATVANNIAYALAQPFVIEGHNLFITTSLGIALHPFDGDNPTDLIKNADTAMYHAKEQGRNNFQFFAGHMNASILARLKLEQELREGFEAGQFELHYQPQVDIASGRIVGAEALIRWHHPGRGMVSPAEFIPVAEETGLILPLGEWVLWTACLQMARWTLIGPTFTGIKHISVNVSPRQFKQANFVEIVEKVLRESGLEPGCLELEVTEASLMQNTESTLAMLDHLMKLGVGLVIDDFGIGYSCLAYLKRFPLNGLKIDASFVRDLATDPNDAALTEAIIAMGHRLELKVIAEGVETEAQLNFLRAQGCDEFQGYLESPALPADKFEKLIGSRNKA